MANTHVSIILVISFILFFLGRYNIINKFDISFISPILVPFLPSDAASLMNYYI